MPINRGVDKDVVHVYNGMLLRHEKECNWVIYRDVDRPRDGHIEWNKSEREKQVSCNNMCMWNLQKWYKWTYLQGSNRDAHMRIGM